MPEYFDYEDAILARQEADEIWEENGPLEDDLDDFLREIYADTGYDDDEIEEMMEDFYKPSPDVIFWEEQEDAEDNN